jgi:hypothetical protein
VGVALLARVSGVGVQRHSERNRVTEGQRVDPIGEELGRVGCLRPEPGPRTG